MADNNYEGFNVNNRTLINEEDDSPTRTTSNSDDSSSDSSPATSKALLLSKKSPRKRKISGRSSGSRGDNEDMVDGKKPPKHVGQGPINDPSINVIVVSSDISVSTRVDPISNNKKYIGVGVLFFINLLNYMDRFTIAGVLTQITGYFSISNAAAGLLQTVFIVSYMLAAPIFGYLGDRYNRKIIMMIGMVLWSGFTLASSFITNKNMFYLFLSMRGFVGIGEASYSTISPTLIADMFTSNMRSRMLTIFYFAIPLGSGLGYIVGSTAASIGGSWNWALRVTPVLGIISVILLCCLCPNPERGASETENASQLAPSTYMNDIKYLMKNKSFLLVTFGFTAMAFVIGSLTLWGPAYYTNAYVVMEKIQPCTKEQCDNVEVNFKFGVITCLAGVFGVWIGAEWARRWKMRGQENADAIVCAIANFGAVPFLLIAVTTGITVVDLSWAMIFIADLFLCLTWTLVGDMSLYVVMPARRSTAQAVLILTGHLLGDAGSPSLLGLIYDKIEHDLPPTFFNQYLALVRAMYVTLFVCVVGGALFLIASLYLVEDKKAVDDEIKRINSSNYSSSSSDSMQMQSTAELIHNIAQPAVPRPDLIPNTPPEFEGTPQTSNIQVENEIQCTNNKNDQNGFSNGVVSHNSSECSDETDSHPLLGFNGKETNI